MKEENKNVTNRQPQTIRQPIIDDGVMCPGTAQDRPRIERMFVQFIVVTLKNIKDKAVSSITDKLIDLLHQENFKL